MSYLFSTQKIQKKDIRPPH